MSDGKRVSAILTEEQFYFLANFEERCNNPDISKSSVLRCMIRLFEEADVDVRRVRTEDELLQRSLKALKKI